MSIHRYISGLLTELVHSICSIHRYINGLLTELVHSIAVYTDISVDY